jgi:hypothetical protein
MRPRTIIAALISLWFAPLLFTASTAAETSLLGRWNFRLSDGYSNNITILCKVDPGNANWTADNFYVTWVDADHMRGRLRSAADSDVYLTRQPSRYPVPPSEQSSGSGDILAVTGRFLNPQDDSTWAFDGSAGITKTTTNGRHAYGMVSIVNQSSGTYRVSWQDNSSDDWDITVTRSRILFAPPATRRPGFFGSQKSFFLVRQD